MLNMLLKRLNVQVLRVREDFLSGIRSGVNGTPTFYINGMRYNDSWDQETLTKTLRDIINEIV
ncbi:MAG: protein-disulfide isomerase [Nitrososphaeraceae archaeon]|nr:protein-disulfide isomerase [Nitrososphaeraceae archaeon]